MADYVTEAEVRDFIKDGTTLDAAALARSITVASRLVEQITNRAQDGFTGASSATARYFCPESAYETRLIEDGTINEFGSLTGLVVKLDTDGDGTYETTLTNNTHFYLGPINSIRDGVSGWPYDTLHILANGGTTFPRSLPGYKPPLEITARWGWATTPEPVKFACLLIANAFFGRGENRYGISGIETSGFISQVRQDRDVVRTLAPFIPASKMIA